MTFLGKLFVMVNVGISLTMAFLAFGLYAHGVDWGYDVASPGKQGGVFEERDKEIKALSPSIGPSDANWAKARAELWKAEDERREAREEYVKELKYDRSQAAPVGDAMDDADKAARTVVVDEKTYRPVMQKAPKGHLPEIARGAKVRSEKGKEAEAPYLYSRDYYVVRLASLHEKNLVLLKELDKLIDQDVELTREMYDEKTKVGLRTYIDEERDKRRGLEEELRVVRPLYVNTSIEAALSRKRLTSLQEQIKGLNEYIKSRGMDLEVSRR